MQKRQLGIAPLQAGGILLQPSMDERQVKELATLGLALKSIENGQGAYFVRAYDLMEDLRKARSEHRLDRRMRVYLAPNGADSRRVRYLAL